MARPEYVTDELPPAGSEAAAQLAREASEVEALADSWAERLRTLAQVGKGGEGGGGGTVGGGGSAALVRVRRRGACPGATCKGSLPCIPLPRLASPRCSSRRGMLPPCRPLCLLPWAQGAALKETFREASVLPLPLPQLGFPIPALQTRRGVAELLVRAGDKPAGAGPEALSFWVVSHRAADQGRPARPAASSRAAFHMPACSAACFLPARPPAATCRLVLSTRPAALRRPMHVLGAEADAGRPHPSPAPPSLSPHCPFLTNPTPTTLPLQANLICPVLDVEAALKERFVTTRSTLERLQVRPALPSPRMQ